MRLLAEREKVAGQAAATATIINGCFTGRATTTLGTTSTALRTNWKIRQAYCSFL